MATRRAECVFLLLKPEGKGFLRENETQMLLHEVEFLRKRAGVPSQGQVAVCCYGNRERISYEGGKSGGSGRAEKKMVSEGRQGGRSLQMEREQS